MQLASNSRPRGFTLLETVIAIGVLAVLLTGFLLVFTPAADGIRKSLNIQQADRLASTLEQELVTLRSGQSSASIKTGFDKAFEWIKGSYPTTGSSTDALLLYQYRGNLKKVPRVDGSLEPPPTLKGKLPGEDYVVVPMLRRLSDLKLTDDFTALEGGVYLVKCTQLIFKTGQLSAGTPGSILDPKSGNPAATTDVYPEAVIAFSAEFYIMPAKTKAYFTSTAFTGKFPSLKNPVFIRNLAVRR